MKLISIVCGLNLTLLSLCSFLQPVHSITLKLLPQTQNVTVGNSVIIDVQISELGEMESPSVGGFDFDLNYDPTILSFDSITFSGLIDLSGSISDEDKVDNSTPGLITLFDLFVGDINQLNAVQPSDFNLATLNFTANGVTPNSSLSLTIVELLDEIFAPLNSVIPEDATVAVESVKTTVPEPNFGIFTWIFFLGLAPIYYKKVSS